MSAPKQNRKVALLCLAVAGTMVTLAYASVPLYRLFCQVTGYGGTPRQATIHIQPNTPPPTPVTVRFDANVRNALPWTFTPKHTSIDMRPGQLYDTSYIARNTSSQNTTGMATFNVTPHDAGYYLVKIECFCFREQTLRPGEEVDMKVSLYVDPSISQEEFRTLTLSYTFFPHNESP